MAAPIGKLSKNILHYLKLFRNNSTVTFCNYCTVKRSVKLLLETKSENDAPKNVTAEGWVTSTQKHRKVTFFHMSDGTTSEEIQVVCGKGIQTSGLGFGSSVSVTGDLVKSHGKGQTWEFLANDLKVLGECDADKEIFLVIYEIGYWCFIFIVKVQLEDLIFPIQHEKVEQSNDYTREFLHLRPRSQYNACLLRIRNAATMAIHKYFQERDFIYIHTPMLSSNDCEGAGEVFTVAPASKTLLEAVTAGDPLAGKHFFGSPTFLTVSGQLHLEAITGAFKKAYSFGPTFRAESQSKGRHHLSEFYMVEGELAFIDNIQSLIQVMEDLVKVTICQVLEKATDDLQILYKHNSIPNHTEMLENILQEDFKVIQYADAVKIIERNNDNFDTKIEWGSDLSKQHEKYLVREFGHSRPVFVIDFPAASKPFYAIANSDNRTVAAVDLLVPDVGELFGGSMREHRYNQMKDKLEDLQLTNSLEWYLDLRKYGSVPHGGFGMGFERYLQFLTGTVNIKDTIPFPRTPLSCKM